MLFEIVILASGLAFRIQDSARLTTETFALELFVGHVKKGYVRS